MAAATVQDPPATVAYVAQSLSDIAADLRQQRQAHEQFLRLLSEQAKDMATLRSEVAVIAVRLATAAAVTSKVERFSEDLHQLRLEIERRNGAINAKTATLSVALSGLLFVAGLMITGWARALEPVFPNVAIYAERLDGDVEDWCGAQIILRDGPGQPHVIAPDPCQPPLFVDGFE